MDHDPLTTNNAIYCDSILMMKIFRPVRLIINEEFFPCVTFNTINLMKLDPVVHVFTQHEFVFLAVTLFRVVVNSVLPLS